jgi:hypothetical protein
MRPARLRWFLGKGFAALVALGLASWLAWGATARGATAPVQGNSAAAHAHQHGKRERRAGYAFTSREREMVLEYYRGGSSGLPPGLAKRGGNLPPGLERHLERDGTLPPGLQKRLEPLPIELERRLSPCPPLYRRGIIGTNVVIINRRTGLILDIIANIGVRR